MRRLAARGRASARLASPLGPVVKVTAGSMSQASAGCGPGRPEPGSLTVVREHVPKQGNPYRPVGVHNDMVDPEPCVGHGPQELGSGFGWFASQRFGEQFLGARSSADRSVAAQHQALQRPCVGGSYPRPERLHPRVMLGPPEACGRGAQEAFLVSARQRHLRCPQQKSGGPTGSQAAWHSPPADSSSSASGGAIGGRDSVRPRSVTRNKGARCPVQRPQPTGAVAARIASCCSS